MTEDAGNDNLDRDQHLSRPIAYFGLFRTVWHLLLLRTVWHQARVAVAGTCDRLPCRVLGTWHLAGTSQADDRDPQRPATAKRQAPAYGPCTRVPGRCSDLPGSLAIVCLAGCPVHTAKRQAPAYGLSNGYPAIRRASPSSQRATAISLMHCWCRAAWAVSCLPSMRYAVIAGPELSQVAIRVRARSLGWRSCRDNGFPRSDYTILVLLPGQEATVFTLTHGETPGTHIWAMGHARACQDDAVIYPGLLRSSARGPSCRADWHPSGSRPVWVHYRRVDECHRYRSACALRQPRDAVHGIVGKRCCSENETGTRYVGTLQG